MAESAISTHREGGIGRLVIDSPPVNVLTIPIMEDAVAALRDLASDPAVKLIAVQAAGDRAFSAGVDVADHTQEKMGTMLDVFNELCLGLHTVQKPTVALVRRMALGGGCELAASCDMVVASEKATFGQPEIKVGVYPILGVVLYTAMLGPKAANEMLLSGATYSAAQAQGFGLVNRVFSDETFEEEAERYLATLAANSGVVSGITKKAILTGQGKAVTEALEAATRIYIEELMVTHDANEGLAAFIEKRAPVWKEA